LGVYFFLHRDEISSAKMTNHRSTKLLVPSKNISSAGMPNELEQELSIKEKEIREKEIKKERQDLDQIGTVINAKNAEIDRDTKIQIKLAKKVFEFNQELKEKQTLLEQSYLDKATSIKDIKRLQVAVSDMRGKLKQDLDNTEKWDPRFVYYLMMQEHYSYKEVNGIKSLLDNGLNTDEITYINELIKQNSFLDKINTFKGLGDSARSVASLRKKPRERDEFIEDSSAGPASAESKLIEMDYNTDSREEMVYGNQ
jgi:hypothetical protein